MGKKMRILGVALIGMSATILGFSASSEAAARGRVKVSSGEVLTDCGTRLRGCVTDPYQSASLDFASLRNNYGFNTGHVYAGHRWGGAMSEIRSKVDPVIKKAEENGMYIVLSHGQDEAGKTDAPRAREFWNYFASIYADRPHVLYEIINEPVAWDFGGYGETAMALQQELYNLIRSKAPRTHIMLFGSANMSSGKTAASKAKALKVDWSNASVSFHSYNSTGIGSINDFRANCTYALFCTEISTWNAGEDIGRMNALEQGRVSWVNFRRIGASQPERRTDDSNFKQPANKAGLSWVPDYGSWPKPSVGCKPTAVTSLASATVPHPYVTLRKRVDLVLGGVILTNEHGLKSTIAGRRHLQ